VFCQTKIGHWTEADARALLGEPSRQRLALGQDQSETGLVLAFADPTGRYKELNWTSPTKPALCEVFLPIRGR